MAVRIVANKPNQIAVNTQAQFTVAVRTRTRVCVHMCVHACACAGACPYACACAYVRLYGPAGATVAKAFARGTLLGVAAVKATRQYSRATG